MLQVTVSFLDRDIILKIFSFPMSGGASGESVSTIIEAFVMTRHPCF